MSSCSVDLCLLTDLLAHFLAGLCSGCCGASVAMRTADLYKCFSISRCRGKIKACALRASVGDVRRPPVIARVPALCTDDSLLLHSVILPAACIDAPRLKRIPHTSTA